MSRRTILVAAGILASFGIAAVASYFLIDKESLRPVVESQLSRSLNRRVTFANLDFSILPPSLILEKLEIADDPGFPAKPFLTAPELRVRVALWPLLRKRIEIQSLRAVEPALRFVKNPAGVWNVATLGGSGGGGGGLEVALNSLRLEKAKLHVNGFDAPTMTLDLRDTRIAGGRTTGSLSLLDIDPQADLRFDVTQNGPVDVALTAGASRLTLKGTSSDLAIELPSTPVQDLAKLAALFGVAFAPGYRVGGSVAVSARIRGPQTQGTASLTNLDVSGGDLKQAVRVPKLVVEFTPDALRSQPFEAISGPTKLTGLFSLAQYLGKRPNLEAAIMAKDSRLEDLLAMARTYGVRGIAGVEGEGRVNLHVRLHGAPSALQYRGTGDMDLSRLKAPPLDLANVRGQATFSDERLILAPLTADLYGGKHRGEITIHFAKAQPTYEIHSQLEAVESSQLIGLVAPALRQSISGPLTANLNLHLAGRDSADLARSLSGNVKLNLSKGRLMNFNLLEELGSLAKFLRVNPQSNKFTSFVGLAGDLSIRDGVASTENLKLNLEQASTTLSGTLGLTDQKLNLRMSTVLTRAYSDEIGGTKIGGYLNAAVANPRGELVLPTIVTGTFAQPRFTPDAGAIAKLKMQSFVPPGSSMEENVRGVIDLFKKRPPKKQP